MQSTQKRYRIFETFCVRNPLLPFDFIKNITQAPDISYSVFYQSWQNPKIIEADFLASPMLFFELRNFESEELIKKSMEKKLESMFKNVGKKSKREISADEIDDIFNL